jgi:hypothetical protein
MIDGTLAFWLIHLFLGVVVPVLALTGCCRRDEERAAQKKEASSEPKFIF